MSISRAYAIAAGHSETAAAAELILREGGNAYDAVLAAMMMSFVAEPLLSSPGGGGFLLAAGPDLKPQLLDFFSDTPSVPASEIDQAEVDFYTIEGDFGKRSQEFHIGHAAAAVPAVPAGVFKIHQNLCSLPLHIIAQPAIEMAQQGIEVNHQQAYVAMILQPVIGSSPEAKTLFTGFHPGSIWKNEQLADFLDSMSKSNHDWFYQGEVAQGIINQGKGLLKEEDFKSYQCEIRKPLKLSNGKYDLFTNPAPSSGGYLIIEQLRRLKARKDAVAILEAMQHADDLKRNPVAEFSRGTTHMSVADSEGNLASLTLSNGEGNGKIVAGCGFMMNNFLGEEDINNKGFFNWQQKQRMQSMMSPTLIIHPDRQVALGTGGSNRIKSALFQVINHLVNDQKTLKQAVAAPRIHYENGHLDIEPGFLQEELSLLKKQLPVCSEWRNHNLYFGGVNAVQTGAIVAASADFRRSGSGIVGYQ